MDGKGEGNDEQVELNEVLCNVDSRHDICHKYCTILTIDRKVLALHCYNA